MQLNEKGKDLIKFYEGCKLVAYKCSANHDTIGFGNTFYEDGTKVKPGDKISQERANDLFNIIAKDFADKVAPLVKSPVTPNQFGALVSFAYNAGIGNLKSSTLLKKVNANPNDPSIALEFAKWVRANNKVLAGLEKRRAAESKLYFTP
jgi:lysozyme